MRRLLRVTVILGILLMLLAPTAWADKLKVVATTSIAADLMRDLGGHHVEVVSLMGVGVDPHDYRATQGDIRRLRSADLIVYHGLNLEERMSRALAELARETPTLVLGEAVPEAEVIHVDGEPDPHVWMSPRVWMHAVHAAEAKLAELLPERKFEIEGNRIRLITQLSALDQDIRTQFGRIPEAQRVLVTAHDAFNYMGRDYNLEIIGLQGMSTSSEAGLRDIQRVRELVMERGIPAIFYESSVSPRAMDALKKGLRESGHEVVIGGELYSDSLGPANSPEGNYTGMIRHNVRLITEALMDDPTDQIQTAPALDLP